MVGKYKKYPDYKDSESKWLDILPKHWGRSPLKYLVAVRITDGPHETPEFVDRGIPFLSAEAVKNNSLDFTKKRGYITRVLHNLYSKKCLPQIDDVFMVKSGNTTGSLAIVQTKEEFNIWSPLALIRANQIKILPLFLFYSMQAEYFQKSIQLTWSHGTQPNIGMGVIENLHISTAPLNEQKNIISFLDHETAKIDTLIEKQQALIKLLKEKRQAVISHAVTKGLNPDVPMKDSGVEWLGEVPEHWEVSSLRWYIKICSGENLSNSKFEPEKNEENFYPVIGGNGILGYTKYINSSSKTIVIGRVGALCGNIHFYSNDCWITDNALKIYNWIFFQDEYLSYFLLSSNLNELANKNAQPLITGNQVKSLYIYLPPKDEQIQIAKFIDEQINKIDILVEKSESAIQLLKERRTALISAVVTGKIDVRDWKAPEE